MNNPTDTNQASELAELCKEVYEKTGWIVGDESWEWHTTTDAKLDSMFIAPKYYTDYLLEKLPDNGSNGRVCLEKLDDGWHASLCSQDEYTPPSYEYDSSADTPLLALLKLTIAISEAGELK